MNKVIGLQMLSGNFVNSCQLPTNPQRR